jgi:hypothetical protein
MNAGFSQVSKSKTFRKIIDFLVCNSSVGNDVGKFNLPFLVGDDNVKRKVHRISHGKPASL